MNVIIECSRSHLCYTLWLSARDFNTFTVAFDRPFRRDFEKSCHARFKDFHALCHIQLSNTFTTGPVIMCMGFFVDSIDDSLALVEQGPSGFVLNKISTC